MSARLTYTSSRGKQIIQQMCPARDGLIVDVVKVEDSKVSARRKLEEPFSLI